MSCSETPEFMSSEDWQCVSQAHTRVLESICYDMRQAVTKRDRRWMGLTYKDCLSAKEIVDWLSQQKFCPDREEAVKIGRALQKQKFIVHVWGSHTRLVPFADTNMFFRYTPAANALQAPRQSAEDSDDTVKSKTPQTDTVVGSSEERTQTQNELEALRAELQAVKAELEVKRNEQEELHEDVSKKRRETFLGVALLDAKRKELEELNAAIIAAKEPPCSTLGSLSDSVCEVSIGADSLSPDLDSALNGDDDGQEQQKKKQLEALNAELDRKRREYEELDGHLRVKQRESIVGAALLDARRQELVELDSALASAQGPPSSTMEAPPTSTTEAPPTSTMEAPIAASKAPPSSCKNTGSGTKHVVILDLTSTLTPPSMQKLSLTPPNETMGEVSLDLTGLRDDD